MVELGKTYKDRFTSFEGLAIARAEYLYGGVRICLAAKKLKDGAPNEAWFDEQRLVVQRETKPKPERPGAKKGRKL